MQKNIVNFKLIQTVLYLLARHLRILDRRVSINIGAFIDLPSSTLSVTEIKVHAEIPKKGKQDKLLLDKRQPTYKTISKKGSYEHVGPNKGKTVSKKDSYEKITPGQALSRKSSVEETSGRIVSKKTSDEKIAPGKDSKKKTKQETKKQDEPKSSKFHKASKRDSIERSTSVNSELKRSDKVTRYKAYVTIVYPIILIFFN